MERVHPESGRRGHSLSTEAQTSPSRPLPPALPGNPEVLQVQQRGTVLPACPGSLLPMARAQKTSTGRFAEESQTNMENVHAASRRSICPIFGVFLAKLPTEINVLIGPP